MRILAGVHKGKNISVPAAIRPVSLIMRKACFDILGEEIKQRRVLDLFAGSGSLGLEALSRGAREATFVDKNKNCLTAIEKNIHTLGEIHRTRSYLKDAFIALRQFHQSNEQFDIIFLDPPYYHGILTKALQALQEYGIVTPSGYVAGFCYEKDDYSKMSKTFSLIIRRNYGQSTLVIYRN